MRNAVVLIVGGFTLAVAYLVSAAGRVTRPRWWERLSLRRDLRSLAHYRRNLRHYSAQAERRYRRGDLDVGRELAACAVLLADCDEQIDRTLDRLDELSR